MITDGIARVFVKLLVAEGGIALACILALLATREFGPRVRRTVAVALAVAAVAASACYIEFGTLRYGRYMNPHDFYHYYIASKYADELGYNKLYGASVLADAEGKRLVQPNWTIRNLNDHTYLPVREVFAKPDAYRGEFSPARWAEFVKDIEYFQSIVPVAKWQQMIRDKGYNGTPVWTTIAGLLSNRISTSNEAGMFALAMIDPILLVALVALVWAVFGYPVAMLLAVFMGTTFFMNFVHIKGAFLRMDWLLAMALCACALKRERHATAGAALAYAASIRVFPAIFAFGIGAKLIWDFLETRKVRRDYWHFFGAFAAVLGALAAFSAVYTGGTEYWREFLSKISLHNGDISTTRVGFKYIFLWPYETGGDKFRAFEAHQGQWMLIQGAVLAVTFLASRRLRAYEALCLGFVPFFFLTAPTFYYYVVLAVPFLYGAANLERPNRLFATALFFALSIAGYFLNRFHEIAFPMSFYLSCLLLALCTYMIADAMAGAWGAAFTRFNPRRAVRWLPAIILAVGAAAMLPGFLGDNSPVTTPPPPPAASKPVRDGLVSLALTGDVMMSRNVAKSLLDNRRGYDFPFANTTEILRAADLAFCNVECPISGRGKVIEKRYTFNAAPESAWGIAAAGIDIGSMANNHVLDYGEVAMRDTAANLVKNKVQPLGLTKRGIPQDPFVTEIDGVRIGFLAYVDPESPYGNAKEFAVFPEGPALGDNASVAADIQRLKATVDIVAVSVHWGVEYELTPNARQRAFGNFIIDQGAHLVIGHHPHVLQDAEWYGDGLIIYSLGNFVFDQKSRPPTRESRIFRVWASKAGIQKAEYLPLFINDDWQPTPKQPDFVALAKPEAPK